MYGRMDEWMDGQTDRAQIKVSSWDKNMFALCTLHMYAIPNCSFTICIYAYLHKYVTAGTTENSTFYDTLRHVLFAFNT